MSAGYGVARETGLTGQRQIADAINNMAAAINRLARAIEIRQSARPRPSGAQPVTDSLHYLSTRAGREIEDLTRWMGTLERRAAMHLSEHDGYPTATISDGTHGTAELTSVERAADARLATTAGMTTVDVFGGIDQLRDDYTALLDLLGSMRTIRDRLIRLLPADQPTPRRYQGCEADPDCDKHVHARGMCATHYQQARRQAAAQGIDWADPTPTERPDDSPPSDRRVTPIHLP